MSGNNDHNMGVGCSTHSVVKGGRGAGAVLCSKRRGAEFRTSGLGWKPRRRG